MGSYFLCFQTALLAFGQLNTLFFWLVLVHSYNFLLLTAQMSSLMPPCRLFLLQEKTSMLLPYLIIQNYIGLCQAQTQESIEQKTKIFARIICKSMV